MTCNARIDSHGPRAMTYNVVMCALISGKLITSVFIAYANKKIRDSSGLVTTVVRLSRKAGPGVKTYCTITKQAILYGTRRLPVVTSIQIS